MKSLLRGGAFMLLFLKMSCKVPTDQKTEDDSIVKINKFNSEFKLRKTLNILARSLQVCSNSPLAFGAPWPGRERVQTTSLLSAGAQEPGRR